MLPLPLQFVIAMVAHALNERIARRVDYLQEEVRVLREALATATGKSRIAFTPEQRRRLAILAWSRQLAAKKYDSSKARTAARPRKAADPRELVLELARANPGWGYTKIRDALRGLKIEIPRAA